MGITVWKRGLTLSRFHMGITVTIRGFNTRYHMGIPIWERGLLYPHIEMVNHRFHMGIEKFMIPVSMWGSPYGNGD